jgi:hypothetical protein
VPSVATEALSLDSVMPVAADTGSAKDISSKAKSSIAVKRRTATPPLLL